jgi:hypothetical protein
VKRLNDFGFWRTSSFFQIFGVSSDDAPHSTTGGPRTREKPEPVNVGVA